MATMYLYFGSSIKSITVHANNDYYPQTFTTSGTNHTLSNLPSSGNIWIVPSNDVTCASGYTTPINITTQNPSGSWKLDNDNYVAITNGRSMTITATQGSGGGGTTYTTYALNLRTGTGISSYNVRYLGSSGSTYNTASVSNSAASTVCWTRANTNLEITSINYADYYGAPFNFVEYTSSTFSSIKKTFSDNDDQVYSSGTRYVKLTGSQTSYPTYAISLRTGTGVSSYNATYTNSTGGTTTASVSNSAASTVCYVKQGTQISITNVKYSTNYASPFYVREYSSDWSRVIASSTNTGITASGTKYIKIEGTYVEPTYKMYLRCGTGVKNFAVYRGSTYVSLNSSTSWSGIDLTESNKTVTVKTISHEDGYGAPDYAGFFASSTSTSPAGSISSSSGELTFTYASNRQYVQISASKVKTPISLFYWNGSDANDTALIQTGKPITNIAAASWNRLNAKIAEVAKALGSSHSYTTVSSGDTMTATLFNQARNGIASLTGRGSIPSTKTRGDTAMSGHFNGVNSLKNGLNVAITAYNA